MNRLFKIARRNIRRTPYQALAATMVMFLTFLTLLLFVILAFGSQKILQYFESKPQAIAFFKDNTTQDDVNAIQNALNQTGKVTSLKYVTKEEALEIYKDKNQNDPKLLELVTANILPSSLEISTVAPSDLNLVAEILKKEPVVEEVVVPLDIVESLTRVATIIRGAGAAAVGFLIIFALAIVLMIIGFKIRIKRTEIEIMNLLGASNWFIRAPFIIEGITYGVIAAITAWIVAVSMLWYFTPHLNFYLQEIPNSVLSVPPSPIFMLALLLIAILVGLIVGGMGSYAAVRRYLRL